MNIFFLDRNPILASLQHVDKHVVKMPLELSQMLSTAHHICGTSPAILEKLYKPAYENHPCSIWIRASKANYQWACRMLDALLEEYTYRYGKKHGSGKIAHLLHFAPSALTSTEFTEPPQAMPDQYKHADYVTAYRNYYRYGKAHLHVWTKRASPIWITEPHGNQKP